MTVNKKSDFVGNHGGSYIDNDGQSKQFTYIDHDKKLKKSAFVSSAEDTVSRKDWMKQFYERRILEVLSMPAVSIAGFNDNFFEHLLFRDKDKGILWNEKVVREAMSLDPNLAYSLNLFVWKRTVKEQYWFDPIRDDHEAILRGEWKSLM